MKLLEIVLALFVPPIAVLIHRGIGTQLIINILLTLLMVLPGIIHALWVISNGSPRLANA